MKKLFLSFLSCLFLWASVEVHAQDQAFFMVSQSKVCLGNAIYITDLSIGGNGEVFYYYGDGTTSPLHTPNPIYTYTTIGSFNLKQILPIAGTVMDPETGGMVGYVSYKMPVTVVPSTKLSATYTLLDNSAIDLFIYDDRFDSYDVDFGDGSAVVNVTKTTSDTTTLNHIYPASTSYTVTIKGKFNIGAGCASTDLTFSVTPLIKALGNYNPLSNNTLSTKLFLNGYGSISTLHVDSTKAENNGLAHYFLKTPDLDQISMPCFAEFSTLVGPKMQTSGTNYYFFNKDNDIIQLSPTKELNMPWTFFTYSNGDYVEATITLKEKLIFLGLTDSVKTISLQRKNGSHANITDPVNSLKIQISKNYGFIQTVSFTNFPNTSYTSSQLIGLSDPEVGQHLLTTRQIYNFDINDEFHFTKTYTNVPYDGDDTKIIRTVIDKYVSANTDTLIYTFQDVRENTHYTFHPPAQTILGPITYNVSSYKETHLVNDEIIYPGIYLEEENGQGVLKSYYYSLPSNYGGKIMLTINYMYYMTYNETDHCWSNAITDGLYNYSSYVEGFGVNYFDAGSFPNSNDSTLVYYKKGNDVNGEPLVLSNYTQSSEQALTLYPNPVKSGEELSFSALHFKTTQCAIYNSSGNKVFESPIEHSDSPSVNLPKLQTGLYVVRLVNDKNEYITSKLIIQ